MGKIVNRSELAEILGKSLPTISAWVARAGFPVIEEGRQGKEWKFDTAQVIDWIEQQAVANVIGDAAKIDYEEARRRKMVAEATLAEIEVDRLSATVAPVDDIVAMVGMQFANVRTRLLAIPSNCAMALARARKPAEASAIVQEAVIDAMSELTLDSRDEVQKVADAAAAELA
ncbi:MAG: terminase small subunit [Solirubrobacterales bacterium]